MSTTRLRQILPISIITIFSLIIRIWHLNLPKGYIFDEIYYAKNANSLIEHGVELNEQGGADFIVHPPLGKWLIGIGIKIFGNNEFGWRIIPALVGTACVILIYLIAQRLFNSIFLSCTAALLMALDGLALVMSRVALLDIFLMFFILLCCYFILTNNLWLSGVAIGLAGASKWSGFFLIPLIIALTINWKNLQLSSLLRRLVQFIFIPIDSVKFEFDYESKNKAIENELLEQLRHKIKMKFVHFDSNCDLIFTKYPDAFRNADDHIVKEEESKYDHLIKKAPTIFKALKKGKISMNIDFLSDWRSQTEKKYTFDYDLGNVYIVETDPFENNYNVKILIPAIKINCDENPDLNNNQRIKMDILDKIKQKFQQFGLNVIQRATKFHLKHNGTWVKL